MNVETSYIAAFAIFFNCLLSPHLFRISIYLSGESQYSSLASGTLQVCLYLLFITSAREPLTLLHPVFLLCTSLVLLAYSPLQQGSPCIKTTIIAGIHSNVSS